MRFVKIYANQKVNRNVKRKKQKQKIDLQNAMKINKEQYQMQ